ncbi:MAG: diguanylate cyclase [Proteobacteria bacterium]|nr:diguanylate cyclase [Pseudomonadota bacterium]
MATILIIDDSDIHRAEIRRALEPERIFDRVLEAEGGMQGLKVLLAEPVDVVVCDLEMPGLDGEKLLRMKESSPGGDNIPFLFVTASTDQIRRARLLEDGACDAITKPFHPADLVARLRLHLKIKRLQDELRVKNETLARLSTTDAVTGLRTRRYVTDVLSIEFLRAKRYGTPLSVLMADLDHFKQVNDHYGHPAGDTVLRGVSSLLIHPLRASDVAGRYGGEEILAILPQNESDGAAILAERWRQSVEEASFESPDGRSVSVTLSIGVAAYRPEMTEPENLISAADNALYCAKDNGRNRVEVAPQEP